MTSLELTNDEKNLFRDWLSQREKIIQEEINRLQMLRLKLESHSEDEPAREPAIQKHSFEKDIAGETEGDSSSWVNLVKKELGYFSKPVPSGEIVKRLLQKPSLLAKGKRFITKAVTSKLWLLQERGEVIKTKENGRYVYALKKP